MTSSLAGSYDGEALDPRTAARRNRYFLEKLDGYTPQDLPGSNNGASCSAHWFTVLGDMVAHRRSTRQGTRILDVSDPTDIKQAGYFRVPAIAARGNTPAQPANNASAAYWHNGYVYVADYTRGIDVLRYTDPIKGVVQPLVCWNACDDRRPRAEGQGRARPAAPAAPVPATLALTHGHAGRVRRVHAGPREGLRGLDDGQRHLDRR